MPWYEELPERWETHKVSELFVERCEKVSDIDFAPLSVSKDGVVSQIATVAKSNTGDNRNLVKIGDFAINSRSDRRGSSGISEYDGSVSLINIVLTPRNETNGKYWHYLLKSHNFIEEYYRNGRGIVADLWTTRLSEMKTVYLPLPPRDKQDQIVRYLDWKVSQINKLINAKRKQIGLLGEQRRAVISAALNRSEWDTPPLYSRYSVVLGKMLDAKKITGQSPVPYLRNIDVQWGAINYSYLPNMDIFENELQRYTVQNGDILVCEGGEAGRCAIVESVDMVVGFQKALHRLRPLTNEENPHFFFYTMRNAVSNGSFSTDKATLLHLTGEKLRRHRFPTPAYSEQCSVVEYLDQQCASIDKITDKLNEEISLFAEYRTRLISDVVTGKLDVRDVPVPEYNTVEDSAGGEINNFDENTEETEE
jgi:type I restriction enzyme S subunit